MNFVAASASGAVDRVIGWGEARGCRADRTPPITRHLIVDRLTATLADPDRTAEFASGLLPPRAEPLSTPIASAVRTRLGDFVRSPRFADLWDGLSRRTHESAVALLTGSDEGRVQIAGDRLAVDLGPLLGPAREAVERAGLTAPAAPAGANPQLVLGDASGIESARGAVELLQKIAWVLPVLGLLCLVGAVFTAPDRRRGILRAGLALVVAMVLLAVGLGIGRSLYLDAVTGADPPEDAAAAAFDTRLRFLRTGLRIVLAVGVLLALGAVLAGRAGADLGPVGRFVRDHRRALEGTAALIGGVVLVALSRQTGLRVLAIAALVEVVAASGRPETP